MITPSRARAAMFSTVCETSVPSRTGNVSRIRPVRRASTIARAGSPRRAGQRRRHQDADHRRRGHVAASQRAVAAAPRARSRTRTPARSTIEAHHQPESRSAPSRRRSGRCWRPRSAAPILLRCERGQADAERAGDAERRAGGRRGAWRPPWAGAGSSDGSRWAGAVARRRSARSPTRRAMRSSAVAGSGASLRLARRPAHLLGDVRPGVALGASREPRGPSPRVAPARGRAAEAPRRVAGDRPAAPVRRRRRR